MLLKFKFEDGNVHCTLLGKNDNAHVGEDAQNHWKKVQCLTLVCCPRYCGCVVQMDKQDFVEGTSADGGEL